MILVSLWQLKIGADIQWRDESEAVGEAARLMAPPSHIFLPLGLRRRVML